MGKYEACRLKVVVCSVQFSVFSSHNCIVNSPGPVPVFLVLYGYNRLIQKKRRRKRRKKDKFNIKQKKTG